MLRVTPPYADVLDKALTYTRLVGSASGVVPTPVKMYRVSDGSLWALHGLLERVCHVLKLHGIQVKVETPKDELPDADYALLGKVIPDLRLRPGQGEAIAKVIGYRNGVLVAPPGWGKTFVIGLLCILYAKTRITVLVPSLSLLRDVVNRLQGMLGVGSVGGVSGAKRDTSRRVTVCSYDSIGRIPQANTQILLIDECHRVPSPRFSRLLAQYRSFAKIWGMTATPVGRSDNAALVLEALVGPIRHEEKYADMQKAGVVVPMTVVFVDMRGISVATPLDRRKAEAAEDGRELEGRAAKETMATMERWLYWRNEERNARLAAAIPRIARKYGLGEDPQTLVLVKTVDHAMHLAAHLPGYEVIFRNVNESRLEWLVDKTGAAARQLSRTQIEDAQSRFLSGKLRKAIATGIWGTGLDFTQLRVVVLASGSASEIMTTQWAGRGSRTSEATGKTMCVVVDGGDQWHDTAAKRMRERRRVYKKHGWKIEMELDALQPSLL